MTVVAKASMLAVIAAAALVQAVHAAPGFTFRDAEFLPLDRGIEAAQEFVATALPSGLSESDARDRLHHANMRCAKPRRDGAVVCDFAEVVHVEGGVLGEHHWTVTLRFDPSARLASATLDQFVIGAGNPGL